MEKSKYWIFEHSEGEDGFESDRIVNREEAIKLFCEASGFRPSDIETATAVTRSMLYISELDIY